MSAPARTLHVFNPWHDEALAAADPHYCPSDVARRLAVAWGELPILWAEQGDAVWLPDGATAQGAEAAAQAGIRLVRKTDLKPAFWEQVDRIEPWGWDLTLRQQLRRAGAPERLLPADAELGAVRRLSSRATTARVLPLLRRRLEERGVPTAGESVIAESMTDVERFLQARQGAMVKSLWSCSGRGVFRVPPQPAPPCLRRIGRLLSGQGGVELEPFFERRADFALEFHAAQGKVVCKGLSLFDTYATGKYAGNVVAPQTEIARRVAAFAPGVSLFPALAETTASVLAEVIGCGYTGPLGVDMMWGGTEQRPLLLPCVEVNLRRTMGHAALSLYERGWSAERLPAVLRPLFRF